MKNNKGFHGKNKCGHFRCNQGNRGLLCGNKTVQRDPYYSMEDNIANFTDQVNQPEIINTLDSDLDEMLGNDAMSPSMTYDRRLMYSEQSNDHSVLENIYNQSSEMDIKVRVINNKYTSALLLGRIAKDPNEAKTIRDFAKNRYAAKVLTNIFGF